MKLDQAFECGGCNSERQWILHNVRDRGIYRRLCTSCVLKFHAGLFCPVCFEVYEGTSLLNDRVMCLNCPSVSHKACVSEDIHSTYVCPSCSNPSFVFFDSLKKNADGGDGTSLPARNRKALDKNAAEICPVCLVCLQGSSSLLNDRVMCLNCPSVSHKACVSEDIYSTYVCPSCSNPSFVFFDSHKKNADGGDGTSLPARNRKALDKNAAEILVAAAKISSISMSKAATAARVEAERRVKEAAFAKKRAREALERVASLGFKEKEKEKEKVVVNPTPVSVVEQKKKPKGNNSAVTAAVAAQKRIQNQYRAFGNDKSRTVPATLNNVRQKERSVGLHAPSVVQKPSKNGASIEKMDKLKGSSPAMGYQQLQSSDTVKEKKSDLPNQVVPVQKDKNGLVSSSSFARHPPQISQDREKDGEKSKAFADSGAATQLIHSSQDTLVSM